MRIKSMSPTILLATGAITVAMFAAPAAAAASTSTGNPSPVQTTCGSIGPGSECVTPGNAQIDDAPPGVGYDPYGEFGLAFGGFGGGFGGGGFHGGGFHGGGHR
ncbi:hypothetical protein [Mycolicibacterium stellerae]|uniref:hypothetical protein n=1 Tax=Mycolicibacterium stellerae TaxID=2358193 RepID=UPI001F436B48|nr:hypothetical protein [Mycolicibacterium stellerae]